ncbi:MAG: glycosyltransferase 87 family protein [Euryarchaeota archaeon]|nr:glycosyltransferase 87 family protein [Euryarchaeota archaeon]
MLIYGTGIATDMMYLSKDVAPELSHPDVPRYQNRTQTILDGGLLYRDVHTETPPLINYILIPAQLVGGADHVWVWSIYFSLFAFFLATMMYLSFRKVDENKAFLASFMVVLCPFLISESSLGEDESIMAFFFMLAAILMFYDRRKWSAVAIAAGIWIKMFPLLLLPTEFLRQRNLKDKTVLVTIVLLVTLLVTGAFVILCYDDFTYFLNFYFLGDSSRTTGGQSMWHFLDMGGFEIPRMIELGIIGVGMVATYLYCYIKKLGVWESMTLVMLAFFVLYPKVHTGYYVIIFTLLVVWAVENKAIALRIYLSFVPIIASVAFSTLESDKTYIEFESSWLVGLALNLAGTILLIDATRLALKSKPFINAGKENTIVDAAEKTE